MTKPPLSSIAGGKPAIASLPPPAGAGLQGAAQRKRRERKSNDQSAQFHYQVERRTRIELARAPQRAIGTVRDGRQSQIQRERMLVDRLDNRGLHRNLRGNRQSARISRLGADALSEQTDGSRFFVGGFAAAAATAATACLAGAMSATAAAASGFRLANLSARGSSAPTELARRPALAVNAGAAHRWNSAPNDERNHQPRHTGSKQPAEHSANLRGTQHFKWFPQNPRQPDYPERPFGQNRDPT